MTKNEIIEMARQAGMNIDVLTRCRNIELLEPFVKLVAQQAQAEEREACANACEDIGSKDYTFYREESSSSHCADAIRARGQA